MNKNEIAVINNNENKPVKPVKNSKKVNLSFDAVMQLMHDCGIGSKSNTKNYRIMNGGSSIHVLKTKYRMYATQIDFELCSKLNDNNIELLRNDNAVDTKRPHTILVHSDGALKKVFNALTKNALNAPC